MLSRISSDRNFGRCRRLTAFYIKPDKEVRYKKKKTEYKIVLSYYNDCPKMVNWYHEYKDKSVGEASTDKVKKIKKLLKTDGWKKE